MNSSLDSRNVFSYSVVGEKSGMGLNGLKSGRWWDTFLSGCTRGESISCFQDDSPWRTDIAISQQAIG
jgi:hypothetical protein